MSRELNIGFIGTSFIAQVAHLVHYSNFENVKILYGSNDIGNGLGEKCRGIPKMDETIIRNESAALIERVFFPKKIITIDKFPLSESGKIDRKALALMAKALLKPKTKTF